MNSESKPDTVWTIKRGWWPLYLVGAVFLLLGLGTLALLLAPGEPVAPAGLLIGLASFFGLAGAGLTLGRRGITIDRGRDVVFTWWGLLIPIVKNACDLRDYNHVSMVEETRSDGNDKWTVYAVYLDSSERRCDGFLLISPKDYKEARFTAEGLAKALECPMAETARGRKVVREHHHLDESIRERAQRTGVKPDPAPAPQELHSTIEKNNGAFVAVVPPAGQFSMSTRELIVIVAFGVALIPVFAVIAWWLDVPQVYGLGLLSTIPVTFLLCGKLFHDKRQTKITATAQKLTLEESDAFGITTTETPADEIEELVLHARGGRTRITAITDDGAINFASGLPDDELKYIHAQVLTSLTS